MKAQQIDAELAARIPDLSSGVRALGDCLVAVEFYRAE
jgi:hypothetical protein